MGLSKDGGIAPVYVQTRERRGPCDLGRFIPSYLRECAAEFLGVMILMIFGLGTNCQATLSASSDVSSSPMGNYVSVIIGWAAGIALGVWASGGHINPAITLVMAVHRRFPWRKVPGYVIAQVLGGITGAALVYANYFHAIDIVEGGRGIRTLRTAGLFGTYSLPYMTDVSSFFSEFLATAIFTIGVLSATDKRQNLSAGGVPGILFVVTIGVVSSLGMETSFALNPARDFGPRVLTAMVGYGSQVFTYRRHYWIWCPILATILGAQSGAVVYDLIAPST
ncbi:hypothetical protein AX16_003490 [Volvariella volvacea WC 439]|nr:hypothetical protein AX16_003490 [Volvariella volvacea WC 439]